MSQVVTWNGTAYNVPDAGDVNWPALTNFLVALGTNAAVAIQMKQAIRVATATPVTVAATTDFCIVTDLSVAGAVAVNLPAGAAGQLFAIIDGKGDAASNNITITPNGAQTIKGAATLVLNHNSQAVILQYSSTGTDWKVLANVIYPGTITSADITGTIAPSKGGTGVANNDSATLTRSGNHALTLTTSNTTNVTLPTTGTLATLAGVEVLSFKTLVDPIVRGDLLLQNPSGAQPTLSLSEDPDNGTNKVTIQAPASLSGDWTMTLPPDDGDSGEALVTNGSGVTTWEPIVTNPMDSAGDMIYGGALGVATKLDSGTLGQLLISGGAGAPTWSDTCSTLKNFSVGVTLGNPSQSATTTTLSYFITAQPTSTFTMNGTGSPGTSGTITMSVQRVGNLVSIYLPGITATTGTGSDTLTANTALATTYRPANAQYFRCANGTNNGVGDTANIPMITVNTNGVLVIQRNQGAPVWTNAAQAGLRDPITISYMVA